MSIIRDLRAEIRKIEARIESIQDRCSHPAVTSTYNGDKTDEYGSWVGPGSYTNTCLLCDCVFSTKEKPEEAQ